MSALLFRRYDEDYEGGLDETLYMHLKELSRMVGGHEYDFGYVFPHRHYRRLADLGLVRIECKQRGNYRWRIARLTGKGEDYVGLTDVRRRRRRRRLRG